MKTLMVLVDFSRAYDRVWKDGLTDKMMKMGVPHHMAKWLQIFLSQRQAKVRINNSYSRYHHFAEGLPQGTMLSPTLFLIFINDLREELGEDIVCSLFADDLALAVQGATVEECERKMQPALDRLMQWAERNKMEVAFDTTTEILFTRRGTESNGRVEPHLTLNGKGWPRTFKVTAGDLKGETVPAKDATKKEGWIQAAGLYFWNVRGRLVLQGATEEAGAAARAVAVACSGKTLTRVNGGEVRDANGVAGRLARKRRDYVMRLEFGTPV